MYKPILAGEGLDGAGKTTFAIAFARAVGGLTISQIMNFDPVTRDHWAAERRAINRGDSLQAHFDFFIRFNRWQKSIAQTWARDGYQVVLDSSIYRTIATHRGLGMSVELEDYPNLTPDHTWLLRLPEHIRENRMRERDGGDIKFSSKWDVMLHERQAEVRAGYESFNLPTLEAELPPETLVELARSQLEAFTSRRYTTRLGYNSGC